MSHDRRSHLIAATLVAVVLFCSDARAQNPAPANAARIDKTGILILLRQTLAALDFSNKSGNYTILREASGPGFAVMNDAARLSKLFQNQRDRNLDYSGALVYEPQITEGPEITKMGILRFAGFFPSPTNQIKFEMHFQPVNGQWRLFGLAADITPLAPAAPIPQVNAPAPKAAPTQSNRR